ncbi:hypothetical protein ACFL6S_19685 [Candidatus Poribacteria bacterium]
MMTKSMGLRAGAAIVDITPDMGVQLAGDIGRFRPTEEIRERLYAHAVVLESSGTRLCLLSLDLCIATGQWSDEIRRRASERFGLDTEAIMFHVVQNHAAPSLGHLLVSDECDLIPPDFPWLRGGHDSYNEPTVEKTLDAIDQAIHALEPAELHVGRGVDGRVAFNRRFIMRDGSVLTHPGQCNPDVLHVEGPADPEVGVMTLTAADGRAIAMILHHTCHPCHGYPHRYVISDWPGVWAEMMGQHAGKGCVPFVVNGCCGNIHHNNHLDPHHENDHRRMAGMLSETAKSVLNRMELQGSARLSVERTVLKLPLRLLTDDVINAARRFLDEYPEPKWIDAEKTRVDWDWMYAVATLDLKESYDRKSYCEYEIQAFRIGDTAIVTLMGEPFVEAQLKIKLESPASYTFVAHQCNGYVGYVPTSGAFSGGGYETRTANWSKLQPEALDTIVNAATELLRKLF